ncbi:MAG: DUF4389 domain-containing protein [Chloroflexi bacterium]|nr:DUF4389 domain-containing protein [Chloroflexota bacterium]
MPAVPGEYPVRFSVDYPERRDRLSVLLRPLLIIPIVVLYALLAGDLVAPIALMLLFRRKYQRWWFEWNRELSRFGARVGAYALLLRDEYPSTDEEQSVHLAIDEPDAAQLNRWLPLVKWLLAIPHYLILVVLVLSVVVTTFIAWVAILVTGQYPRGLFEYAVGVGRWCNRVGGYAFLLVTDRYPPFSLK